MNIISNGTTVVVYGQLATVVEKVNSFEEHTNRYALNHAVVVPGIEYTRDVIDESEIQRVIDESNKFDAATIEQLCKAC